MEKIKLKSANAGSFFTDRTKPKTADYLIIAAVIIFCYLTFNHSDLPCTATHGKDLIECILQGKFFEFYDYAQGTAAYLLPTYIIFAVWSLPVMIIYAILKIPLWGAVDFGAVNFGLLMWYKLLPTLFYLGAAYILYLIAKQIKLSENTGKWLAFLWISSPIAMFGQFAMGQYDSIGLFFTLWALLMFFKKKYYLFSVLISVAVTFKLFPIFMFIPLVLLIEKRPLHIVKHGLIGIAGWVVCNVVFIASEAFHSASDFGSSMISRFVVAGIPHHYGIISLFYVGFLAICVIAFMKKTESDNELNYFASYISFFVYALIFATVLWHPQWVMLLVPFLCLTALQNKEIKISLLLETVISAGYFGITLLNNVQNVDANLTNAGILAKIFGLSDTASLSKAISLFDTVSSSEYLSVFAGGLFILMVMRFPTRKRVEEYDALTESGGEAQLPCKGWVWLRPLVFIFMYVIPSVLVFFRYM